MKVLLKMVLLVPKKIQFKIPVAIILIHTLFYCLSELVSISFVGRTVEPKD